MSMAIKYRMSKGGMCEHGSRKCEMCHGVKMAEGGSAEDIADKIADASSGRYDSSNRELMKNVFPSAKDSPSDRDKKADAIKRSFSLIPGRYAEGGEVDERDLVERIMKKRHPEPEADSDDAEYEFEDKAPDDANYSEENSGDDDGSEKVDEDDRDIVNRIMRKHAKARMPRPA